MRSSAEVTNVWKFVSASFVVSNIMVLRQCLYGIYFPKQPATKYRTHSRIIFIFLYLLFFLMDLQLFCLPRNVSACVTSCISFSLTVINCQYPSPSPLVSVLLSIFLSVLCSILEERDRRKKPHR